MESAIIRKMFPLFAGVAIIGGLVAIFFLRAKRKHAAHPDQAIPGSNSRASSPDSSHRKARTKVITVTEEPNALRTRIAKGKERVRR
jgi:hypothetical protein